ncbi:MAG: anti-sigma factor [Chitinophagaceae bacterium]
MSGIIESYVLGLATPEEQAEFERLCLQHPELVDARNGFEMALEKRLLSEAVIVPREVKEKVISSVSQQPSVNQTKIITMQSSNTNSSSSPLRWVAAASVILLIGAAFFTYKFYSENKDLQAKIQSSDSLLKSNQDMLGKMAEEQRVIQDPNVAVVNMVGTEKAPTSSANIYWDSTSANVYLVVRNMPKLPNDKQYQLWSLINGQDGKLQPTSLGLFDVGDNKKLILKMNNTQKADAFAITIENRGNTGGPDLGQLQNMGKTKL